MFQKTYGSEKEYEQGGGGSQDFSWKTFCLTVPKLFSGGNHLVFVYFRLKIKFRLERAMKESRFSMEKFSLTVTKDFGGNAFVLCFRDFC